MRHAMPSEHGLLNHAISKKMRRIAGKVIQFSEVPLFNHNGKITRTNQQLRIRID